jgi:glutamine amidotransferase-like uncharacterized protein
MLFALILVAYCFEGSINNISRVQAIDEPQPNDLELIRVAVFNGTGAGSDTHHAQGKMYEWMGCDVTYIKNDDIINGDLSEYDLLGFPGGDYVQYWNLGQEGKTKIQEYVRNGGAYLGICAGAWWASDYMVWKADYHFPPPAYKVEGDERNLDLFPGVTMGPLDAIAPFYTGKMTGITFVNRTHPITDSLPEHLTVLYYGGPEFLPYEGTNVTVLATYDVTGTPAIVAFNYGKGRVVLCGPHPEVEEDGVRDGLALDNPLKTDYTDPESDWPLFIEAVRWLTINSTLSRMQELTDAYRYNESHNLSSLVQTQKEASEQSFNEISAKIAMLNEENSELKTRLEDVQSSLEDVQSSLEDIGELSNQVRILYIITGIALIISIMAMVLVILRR